MYVSEFTALDVRYKSWGLHKQSNIKLMQVMVGLIIKHFFSMDKYCCRWHLLDSHHHAQLTQPSSYLLLILSDVGMGSDKSWNVSMVLDTLEQVRHWTLDWSVPSNMSVTIDLYCMLFFWANISLVTLS